jgi:peptide/nickel transport system substrate-binding protein
MPEAERGSDGEVKIIYWQAPSILNPYLSGGTKEVESASLIIEPLARFDEAGEHGSLARRRDPDGRERRCLRRPDLDHLEASKDGIMWSDGTPVTSADVIFTWEYCTHPEGGCAQRQVRRRGHRRGRGRPDRRVTFEGPTPFPYTAFVGARAR